MILGTGVAEPWNLEDHNIQCAGPLGNKLESAELADMYLPPAPT